MRIHSLLAALFLVSSSICFAANNIYNAGGEASYYGVYEGVNLYVYDGPEEPTHLTVQPGSLLNGILSVHGISSATAYSSQFIGDVWAYESSKVELVSGTYNNIWLRGNSELSLSGLSYGQVEARSTSRLTMEVGSQAAFVRSLEDSYLQIKGGSTLSYVVAMHNGRIVISGGTFAKNPTNGAYVRAHTDSEITISGGNFRLSPYGSANRIRFNAFENGLLKFIGSDFTVNHVPVVGLLNLEELAALGVVTYSSNETHGYYSGTIRGTLQDGHYVENDFVIGRALDSSESANIYVFAASCQLNEELEAMLAQCEADLVASQADVTAIGDQLSDTSTQLSAALLQVGTLTAENAQQQLDIQQKETEIAGLTEQNDQLSQSVADLSQQIAALMEDRALLESQNASLGAQIVQLSSDLDGKAAEIAELNEVVAELTEDLSDRDDELAAAASEIETLTNSNENLSNSIFSSDEIDDEQAALIRVYAQGYIDHAIATGGDSKDIDKALDKLSKGDEKFEDGEFDKAYDEFVKAGASALEAVAD